MSPQQALLTDFSDLDEGVFHSASSAWWTEMFGGTYVYPMKADCGEQPAGATLAQDLSAGDWSVTGSVDQYAGFGVWFAPCLVDMSMYEGFSFTFVGNVGPSRSITAHVITASNTAPSVDPANPTCAPNTATCQAVDPSRPEESCRFASLRLANIGGEGRTISLRFSDFTDGLPDAAANPAEVVGFFFELDWRFDGTAADAYPVDFHIDDLTLVP